MCNQGDWRGFHTRRLKTPSGQDSPRVVIEQCTACGQYRALNIESIPYVDPSRTQDGSDSPSIPDPSESDGDGSVWGPD